MYLITVLFAFLAVVAMAKPIQDTSSSTTVTPTTTSLPDDGEIVTVTIPVGAQPTTPSGHLPTDVPPNNVTTLWWNCSNRDMPDDNFTSITAARQLMSRECTGKWKIIPPRTGVIWRKKNAQVYYCNYGYPEDDPQHEWDGPRVCFSSQYDQSAKYIDDTCSPGGGGWMTWNYLQDSRFTIGRDPRYDRDGNEIGECGF